MREVLLATLLLLPLAPVAAGAPEPLATYDVEARVLDAVDDVVEGISYLRVRLAVIVVNGQAGRPDAPRLGSGTTIMAIVRDDAHRAIHRSASPSQAVPMEVGWFDQGTYEVRSVLGGAPTVARADADRSASERRFSVLQLLALSIGVATLGLATLRLLHRTT